MNVQLIGCSCPESEMSVLKSENEIIYAAAKQCYSEKYDNPVPPDGYEKLLQKVIGSGHLSVAEHTIYTFLVTGISRACSHQLVRHRIASYSQQSQRYVKIENLADTCVIPGSIKKNDKALEDYLNLQVNIENTYNNLLELGIPKEDARFVLSNATPTNIVVSMNARALGNFYAERLCTRAQWEIRELAERMADICKEKNPVLFDEAKLAYPKCVQCGYCTEDKTCGRIDNIYKKYKRV